MKNIRLYNVVFKDHTAKCVKAYTKIEAKEIAEKTTNKKVASVVKCYKNAKYARKINFM